MNRLSQYHSSMSPVSPVSPPPSLPRKGILVSSPSSLLQPFNLNSGPQSLPWSGVSVGSKSEFNSVTFKENSLTWEKKIPRLDPWRREEKEIVPRLEQIRVTDKSNRFHSDTSNPEQKIKSEYVGLDEKRKKGLRVPWYTALDEDISDQGSRFSDSRGGRGGGGEGGDQDKPRTRRVLRNQGIDGERVGRLASLSIADMSPKLALQRILTLWQRRQYREAAAFLRRLSLATFKQVSSSLPTEHFVDCLPHSLPILEAYYSKLFLAGGQKSRTSAQVSPETVVWQLVKFFASQEDQTLVSREGRWEFCGPFMNTCKRLLSVLISVDPNIRRIVGERKKILTRTIEGLGQHGMVGTSDQSLMNLHDALRIELQKVKDQFSSALSKLDELALSGKEPVTNSGSCKVPVLSGHQRQLSLHLVQVQERLIKNKSLLTTVEPAVSSTSLEVLLGILERRVQLDKEVMFQFTSIKRETSLVGNLESDPAVAPILMKFQRGCHQVLELIREIKEEEEEVAEPGSDISGYHSDSDSAIMMSGNSPFVSKNARSNFLLRSVRVGSKDKPLISIKEEPGYLSSSSGFSSLPPSASLNPSPSTSSASPPSSSSSMQDSDSSEGAEIKKDTLRFTGRGKVKRGTGGGVQCLKCEDGEAESLRIEVERLKNELTATRQTIVRMHEREDRVKQRIIDMQLKEEDISISSTGSQVYLSATHGVRLVAKYGELYSRTRLRTLASLDALPELSSAGELKNKLLFSVVVLAFRSVKQTISSTKLQIKKTLNVPPGTELDPATKDLNSCIAIFLCSRFLLVLSRIQQQRI
ncbi:uncharacterized protein LOC111701481 isoform X2 [Eurytemora carolleeae]|uniref:uncharacterized protein LOC111701481 isoform X2 n=1 Tax=Eurytemora carolleeae TaxID=1294199 RepID=UPI000C75ED3D|nr:uncharacterized protein LOC111701481 isoform X2 [Eurytemora carolleeae]|eukprot:XP_023328547.1 uncharacterized protein LOC111701481 isoform X2 [Eurytemora affinis]